jgi:hypothetical protein
MFGIYQGKCGKATWIENVTDLVTARERMTQHAARKPGRYFAVSARTNCIVTEIETFDRAKSLALLNTCG